METHGSTEAASALDSIATSRADLADRLITPPWYYPLLGLMVGGLTAAQAVSSPWVVIPVTFAYGLGVGLLMAAYRKRTGLTVNALRAPRARVWVVIFVVSLGISMIGSLVLSQRLDSAVPPLVGGLLMLPITLLVGPRVDEALRADLRQGPGAAA